MHPNSQPMMQEQSVQAAYYKPSESLMPNTSATGLLWPTPPTANPLTLGDKDGNGDVVTRWNQNEISCIEKKSENII